MNYLRVSDLGLLRLLPWIYWHNPVFSASCLVLCTRNTLVSFLVSPDLDLVSNRPTYFTLFLPFFAWPGQSLLFFFKTQPKHLITEDIFFPFSEYTLIAYYTPVSVPDTENPNEDGDILEFFMSDFTVLYCDLQCELQESTSAFACWLPIK